MARLMIVDDDARVREIIRKYAVYEGYQVDEAENGAQAVELCRRDRYDAITLDVMMPEMDGFEALRQMRAFCSAPVILLSARCEELDRIHGFALGADDYVAKPFSPRELMMRIAAIRKRAERMPVTAPPEVFTLKGLIVDFTARKVSIDGARAELSPKEYDLLFYLVHNRNTALTRERLVGEVWGRDFAGDPRTLDTHVKLLRKSLGPYAHCIVTLRGVGYRFEA